MKKIYLFILSLSALSYTAQAADITITDADLVGGQTYNWTNDNTYILDGTVFLESGGVLNIQAGTVIKGKAKGAGEAPSALIITRGAQIFATGSSSEPIIFTAEADDVTNATDLDQSDRGLWGGVVILGNGILGNTNSEVLVEGLPSTENRGLYGGNDNTDNSGVFQYASIRHAGFEIAPGDELNGLTLGGVGSGTTLNNIEIYANSDDGIEFFGGAAEMHHVVSAFCGDDAIDWDTGWKGKIQFLFILQASDDGDNGMECDGAKPDGNTIYSDPTIYNATLIGSGVGSSGNAPNANAILFRDATAGVVANSIITDYKNEGIEIEDLPVDKGVDSYQKLQGGEIEFNNNIWFGFGEGNTADVAGFIRVTVDAENPTPTALINALGSNGNTLGDPQIQNISRTPNGQLDPRPQASDAITNLAALPAGDNFFQATSYKGAFDPTGNNFWVKNWTTLARNGHLANVTPTTQTITITDNDLQGGTTYSWTKNNTYILDGTVFLEPGGVLNIEAGTVVKGMAKGAGEAPSALIITRGATINAAGTATEPIIFTAEADDVTSASDLDHTDRGLWGGVVILGNGILGNTNSEVLVEGLPSTENRGIYGGNDNADNSGTLKYVSIRHAGFEIAPGDELNGLTLGGVGSGTTLEYIEIYANSDDGIEFFGGAAEIHHVISAFCGDDAVDWDTGWKGKLQFLFILQATDDGDNGMECDGAKPDGNTIYSDPTIYNATLIGSGVGSSGNAPNANAILFRDATAGVIANSIITDYKNEGIEVEDLPADKGIDSYQKLVDGEIEFNNNIWFGFGEGNTADVAGFVRVTVDAENPTPTALINALGGNGNVVVDPEIEEISRTPNGMLDPRARASAVTTDLAAYPSGDNFFTSVTYKGAFDPSGNDFWAGGWSTLAKNGHLAPITGIKDILNPERSNSVFSNVNVYPNPVDRELHIDYTLNSSNHNNNLTVEVLDMLGKTVKIAAEKNEVAGTHEMTFDVSDMEPGIYFVKLASKGNVVTKKLVVR